ncbi:urease accessory UreF family protein [Lichenihabitans sp. Uapishka_5]|uniref:urease accessory protein UreF n=1 Tax=Lichenihabitans sp. Uapishka_5 TaxID=3037302 RepID=UPI0029E7EDA5|nr:urease accessory UreF family protein [Lichenihabitans sp. Uapishka_5]MDX7953005.1 urease accessory UreF family protein [Lichenihabitans sp. Uapishka_5]
MADEALLRLLSWTSPSFPVGAFTYSHGLETAADEGRIADAATLADWLDGLLRHGAARNDGILAAAAWQAREAVALASLNDLALALCPSRERHLESAGQGKAFAAAIRAAWPEAVPAWPASGDLAYPVAYGSACGRAGIPLGAALEALAHGFVANLVSAAIRLGVVGQTGGLRVLAGTVPAVREIAAFAATATLDDLGGAAQQSDVAALRHETLYSRLFRS